MNRRPYLISLGAVLLLSAYPLWMGVKVLAACLREGYVNAAGYPKYVIPYTPIAIALIISVALLPLTIKYGKKLALLISSILGTGLFLLAETGLERVMVFDRKEVFDVSEWQYFSCAVTPQVRQSIEYWQTIGQELDARYSPAFKLHFYLIAILIVLAVLGVVYGFMKMTREKRGPLILQACAVAVFIGLCVYACFTAFYRTGSLTLSPLSAALTGLFFVAFGVTAGAYAGGLLYAKKPALARLLPALLAMVTAAAMYAGELVMMGGALFRFGWGFFFAPIGVCPLAPVDFAVIALSGAVTYALLFLIRRRPSCP